MRVEPFGKEGQGPLAAGLAPLFRWAVAAGPIWPKGCQMRVWFASARVGGSLASCAAACLVA